MVNQVPISFDVCIVLVPLVRLEIAGSRPRDGTRVPVRLARRTMIIVYDLSLEMAEQTEKGQPVGWPS